VPLKWADPNRPGRKLNPERIHNRIET
jgi:hypothetical protein